MEKIPVHTCGSEARFSALALKDMLSLALRAQLTLVFYTKINGKCESEYSHCETKQKR